MEKLLEGSKSIILTVISFIIAYYSIDFLFNKEVSSPSEFEKYKNCQEATCCRHCYRGVFEKGLEYFDDGDIPLSFKYELRDINEHFSLSNIDEHEVYKIKQEEVNRIEKMIGDRMKVDLYWEKVFGLEYR